MINDISPHLALQLPHPDNELGDDVLRLRDALSAIDSKLATLDLLLTSDDLTLDSVQELVGAIKAARTDIGSLNALVASQLAAQKEDMAQQLAALDRKVRIFGINI